MYCDRWFYVLQDTKTNKVYNIEENFAEFKTNPDAIEKIKERYKLLKSMNLPKNIMDEKVKYLYERLKAETYPLYKTSSFITSISSLNPDLKTSSTSVTNFFNTILN